MRGKSIGDTRVEPQRVPVRSSAFRSLDARQAPQSARQLARHIRRSNFSCSGSGDHDYVSSHQHRLSIPPEPFPDPAFHAGSHHRVSHSATGCDANSRCSTRCGSLLARDEDDERARGDPHPISGDPTKILGRPQAIAAPQALAPNTSAHLEGVVAASRARPLARRREITDRPACVFMRARNPWVRRRRIRLG